MKVHEYPEDFDGVAIIGLSGRFPGANSLEQFWDNLCNGVEPLSILSDEELLAAGEDPALLRSPHYVKAAMKLDGMEMFDAEFFGFSPREAQITDPQHRAFLECAWEALEQAGYVPDTYRGRIGVFAGAGMLSGYERLLEADPHSRNHLGSLQHAIATEKDFLSTRVSYRMNLTGPSLSVQTACSTSLVAVHLACQSLYTGDSDLALAGGVSFHIPQTGYVHEEGSILSRDGHCRAFSASATGTIFSSGAGVVALKRFADAVRDGDNIRAVIRGSCINNDGSRKVGYTAPAVDGQARAIAEAQALAGVKASEVSYVETHGTGTILGDPIEVEGLARAFRNTTQQKNFCAIGSLKSNLGHMDSAAGVAGLIKVVLSLEHRTLPPSIHCATPNPAIDFANSPFYVQRELAPWNPPGGRCIAGVSSFGIGGTNAHVVVEEAPEFDPVSAGEGWALLPLSARTPTALDAASQRLAAHLAAHPEQNLADVAYTLQEGRTAFAHRRVLAAKTREEAVALLAGRDPKRVYTARAFEGEPGVVFLFPGQGAQHPQMGRGLYRSQAVFREHFDRGSEILLPLLGVDLRRLMFQDASEAAGEQIRQTRNAQPAIFLLEYALAKLWMSWGITPSAMAGHSLGEFVAATLAGVFSLEDALAVVAERSRLMQELPAGSMLSVNLPESAAREYVQGDIALAAVNAPGLCVLSGPIPSLATLAEALQAKGIQSQLLHTSHAFHSAMMEPMLEPFAAFLARVPRNAPQIPYVSTVTGTWITDQEAASPEHWSRLNRNPVRFSAAVEELLRTPNRILLEVGPGTTLSSLARMHHASHPFAAVNSLPHVQETREEEECLRTAAGRLWCSGANFNWSHLHTRKSHRRVPLPTYPFERKRYWIDAVRHPTDVSSVPLDRLAADAPSPQEPTASASSGETPRDGLVSVLSKIWCEVLGVDSIGPRDNFFELGGHSLMGVTLVGEISRALGSSIPLATLIAAPTLESFIARIEQERSANSSESNTLNLQDVAQRVRNFLVQECPSAQAVEFTDTDRFDEKGILNESEVLILVEFLEESFSITVADRELNNENFGSVRQVAAYVLHKATGRRESCSPATCECEQGSR